MEHSGTENSLARESNTWSWQILPCSNGVVHHWWDFCSRFWLTSLGFGILELACGMVRALDTKEA